MAKFRAILGIPPGETANVDKVCSDIRKRDPSFFYKIFEPAVPEIRKKFENLLFLDSHSKAVVMRNAGWFLHRCEREQLQ